MCKFSPIIVKKLIEKLKFYDRVGSAAKKKMLAVLTMLEVICYILVVNKTLRKTQVQFFD